MEYIALPHQSRIRDPRVAYRGGDTRFVSGTPLYARKSIFLIRLFNGTRFLVIRRYRYVC